MTSGRVSSSRCQGTDHAADGHKPWTGRGVGPESSTVSGSWQTGPTKVGDTAGWKTCATGTQLSQNQALKEL